MLPLASGALPPSSPQRGSSGAEFSTATCPSSSLSASPACFGNSEHPGVRTWALFTHKSTLGLSKGYLGPASAWEDARSWRCFKWGGIFFCSASKQENKTLFDLFLVILEVFLASSPGHWLSLEQKLGTRCSSSRDALYQSPTSVVRPSRVVMERQPISEAPPAH